MSGKPLAFIQALRGIAALAVVLWHASRYLGPYGTGIGATLFAPGAAMGVDLFFLVSGFIMVHTTRGNDASWQYALDFAVKRATRIWPLWTIALLVCVAMKADSGFFLDPFKRLWLLKSIALLPTAGAPGDVPPVYGFPVLSVGWTLVYEVYFYAFFGLAMLCGRWRWPVFFGWLAATLLLIPLATGRLASSTDWFGFLSLSPSRDYAYPSRYLGLMTNPLILLFATGAAIGLIHHSRFAIGNARLLRSLVAVAVLAVACQYVYAFRASHGLFGWGLSLVPLLLVLAIASKRVPLPVPSGLRWLGDISFSLYLFHPAVQGTFDHLAHRFFGQEPSGYAPIVVTTLLSITVAALAHRYLERGLCEYLKRHMVQRLATCAGAAHARGNTSMPIPADPPVRSRLPA